MTTLASHLESNFAIDIFYDIVKHEEIWQFTATLAAGSRAAGTDRMAGAERGMLTVVRALERLCR